MILFTLLLASLAGVFLLLCKPFFTLSQFMEKVIFNNKKK